ncbi:MAG: T9SS type A sorting domain-containing protein, partial [Calditrichales bacterium]
DGSDPLSNTILKATGDTPHWRTVLSAGGGNITKWSDQVSGTKRDIVSDTVWVGDREFEVSDASPFTAGDNIIIYHPCTAGWLAAIDSGGTFYDSTGADPYADFPWSVGSQPILYNRYIKSIDGNKITIDAPVFNHLIREQSQSYIYKYARQGLRTQIGIENLRIDIVTGNQPDEAHAWTAIDLFQVEDAWIRNCTMLHFGLSGIQTGTATRVTVENCKALDPVCVIEGGKRYNFNVYTASQLILFKNCQATNGRHSYVSNGASWTSGCVFLDCTSSGAFASSEGHRRWSQGLLYDNHVELDGPRGGFNPRLLGLYNRAYYGTSHGWAAVHSVAWGCDVAGGDLIVQQPPTAQNYAIGCFGARITGVAPPASFPAPSGYIEGSNQTGLMPRSLYLAQLEDRIGPALGIGEDRDHQHTLAGFILQQNYPNPFNPQTTIAYALPEAGKVKITIFDMTGQKVTELVNARQLKGSFQVVWDGCNMAGEQVASGIYLYRMQSDNFAQSKKMILIR